MSYILDHKGNNIWSGRFDILPKDKVVHGFSTRLGGTSPEPWASLNMGLHVGDDKERVYNNRCAYLHALGIDPAALVAAEQVHGDGVARVGAADRGRGAREYKDALAGVDAMVSNEVGVALMLFFADCVPLIFYDEEHHAIGIAHAGWQGTVKKIAAKTAQRMEQEFQSDIETLVVGIGPSISAGCYEVDERVQREFRDSFSEEAREFFSPANSAEKVYLNLVKANIAALKAVGVGEENIDCAGVCTACDNKWYYSYRADGETGRFAAVIMLR